MPDRKAKTPSSSGPKSATKKRKGAPKEDEDSEIEWLSKSLTDPAARAHADSDARRVILRTVAIQFPNASRFFLYGLLR